MSSTQWRPPPSPKIALMIAAFAKFRDVASDILASFMFKDEFPCPPNISLCKCNPFLFTM
jgi:hypothetical protein